jgi:hypothetical protein
MEQQKKILVEWETANEFVMAVLDEVLKFPRRIPARGQNQKCVRLHLKHIKNGASGN